VQSSLSSYNHSPLLILLLQIYSKLQDEEAAAGASPSLKPQVYLHCHFGIHLIVVEHDVERLYEVLYTSSVVAAVCAAL
jgi:hypothetical protein